LKKLYELSRRSLGEIPRLQEPNKEEKEWLKGRMSGPMGSWEIWD